MSQPFTFLLPAELSAKEPPERRGIARDEVRLMEINRNSGKVRHSRFDRISEFLNSGDLLIFNTSRTLPASLSACDSALSKCVEIRLAQHLPDDSWLALLMCQQANLFTCVQQGMNLDFTEGLTAKVENRDNHILRLWKIRFSQSGTQLMDSIYRLGNPIRYEYVSEPWDLDYYQTVYAKEPGSAEMPSAGRAFTWKLLFDLKKKGIETAQIVLHTGLSSYMDDELDALHPASEEEYFINEIAAQKINRTRREGGRIIAIGTTVVRALESAVDIEGLIKPQHSYTRLHISAKHQLRVVDGLLSGMHEPEASHLDLLTAFLPAEQIRVAYEDAVEQGYLWHEFGDLNLIL